MTATPIPRTLAMTLYADLEVSILDEKPPGRARIGTHIVEAGRRSALLRELEERMGEGERCFWICPRIVASGAAEEGDAFLEAETSAAEAVLAELSGGPLARFGVELLHGRTPPAPRAARIERFRGGATRLLVCTSVVEVGVDVPEATLMVIDGAERFGLAQLHQLRGRIGRGGRESQCFLLGKRSARERMELLEHCDDGFEIAEEDMRRRGMGDLVGLRQAGVNTEGLDGSEVELELVRYARRALREDAALMRRYGCE
jgi:ATP-dependent DNA helicase RecG